MYGLVNRGLEEMVRRAGGDEAWQRVRHAAGVEDELFMSHHAYPDAMTIALVAAAAEELGETTDQILERFGVHWVLVTAKGYGAMLDATGRTLPEFLQNLPNLHTRVALSYPQLDPPRFRCSAVTSNALVLHYGSSRTGLAPFVVGLIRGLGMRFSTALEIERLGEDEVTGEHSFRVRWGSSIPAISAIPAIPA